MRLIFKIQLVEIIGFTEARVVKTTQAAASVASNVATAMGNPRVGISANCPKPRDDMKNLNPVIVYPMHCINPVISFVSLSVCL